MVSNKIIQINITILEFGFGVMFDFDLRYFCIIVTIRSTTFNLVKTAYLYIATLFALILTSSNTSTASQPVYSICLSFLANSELLTARSSLLRLAIS